MLAEEKMLFYKKEMLCVKIEVGHVFGGWRKYILTGEYFVSSGR